MHALAMSATPIPRTLQSALAGVLDLSVIATPPVRRRPVRTFVLPFDPVVARDALLREQMQGGQSFVVCPRISDLEPMRERLAQLAPELDIALAHGRMKADVLDETMVAFADGAHDVLLTTNIIESGWTSRAPTRCWSGTRTASASPTCISCAAASAGDDGAAWSTPDRPREAGARSDGEADASGAARARRRLRHRRAISMCAGPAISSDPSSPGTCG